MTTVLQYLVIAAVIGLIVFGLAVVVFGRGEQLAPLSPRTSPTELPDHATTGQDVRKLKFAMALRGYRMSDVDWALERIAEELDSLRTQVAALSGRPVTDNEEPGPVLAGATAGPFGRSADVDATTGDQA